MGTSDHGFLSSGEEMSFPRPAADVWSATLATLEAEGFKIKSQNDATRMVQFSSGMTLTTWGQNLTLVVAESVGGSTVALSSGSKMPSYRDKARRKTLHEKIMGGISAQLGL